MGTSAPSYLESAADHARGLITHVALHTADPGTTGANEQSGDRAAITWTDSSETDGLATGTATVTVDPGTTVSHYGLWSAVSAGTFRTGGDLPGDPQPYPNGGAYDITVTHSVTDAP